MDLLERLERWLDGFDQNTRYRDDPYFSAAWEDLETYLNQESERAKWNDGDRGGAEPGGNGGDLVDDYRTLEVSPESPMSLVDASYKRLLRRYHPDRYPLESARHRAATEVAKRLNAAYGRIKAHNNSRRKGHHN
jgi:DnaJ-domain-containing protein 1